MSLILEKLGAYKLLFEILIVGSIAVGGLLAFHNFCEKLREEGRAEVRAADALVAAQKVEADRKVEAMWNQRVQKAEQNASDSQNNLNTVLANSGRSLDGLQRTVAGALSANKQPGTTIDSLLAANAALSTVFLDCAARYRTMGQTADGHVIDIIKLQQAWPTNPVEVK